MRRRQGGRPRKPGARKRNGRLRWVNQQDRGHEAALARRVALVGAADYHEARAGYPLGVLALRGLLSDPGLDQRTAGEQTEARHAAGVWFAADYAMTWGLGTPKSHLGDFLLREGCGEPLSDEASAIVQLRYDRKVQALLQIPHGLSLVARIVIAEEFGISEGELPVLRQSLEALAGLSR